MKVLFLLCVLFFSAISQAEERTEIILANDSDILIQKFDSDGKTLLIWVPSEYGIRSGSIPFAYSVQYEGVDVWMVDLHQTYMVPTGRKGYEEFEHEDLYQLIEYAQKQGWKKIFIGGDNRAAGLALKAARQWQLNNPKSQALKGLVFFHPHLVDGYTEIGDKARYITIANETNLPFYLIQPEYSTKYMRSKELIAELEKGGSQVFFHPLKGLNGGYYLRPDEDLNDVNIKAKAKAGALVSSALKLLAVMPYPKAAAPKVVVAAKTEIKRAGYKLKEMTPVAAAPLKIKDEEGRVFNLDDLKGKVVLVNFWATWCGPCVEEIPSLVRLGKKMEGKPFKVVTVDIGETKEHVTQFLKMLKIEPNFKVLFDTDGQAAKDWKIYAYPSNYILGKNHKVRYAFRGALEWDNADTIGVIERLIAE